MQEITVLDALREAREHMYGIGAFNIVDYTSARAVVAAAEARKKPVILQTSVGTVQYYGANTLNAMVDSVRRNAKVPVFLHLDHCRSLELAKECVQAGWDSIMIDASAFPLQENIRITREAADYAHTKGVFAEGELGVIEGVEEEICAGKGDLADYEECLEFVRESHVDFFAPAIGTAHGVYKRKPQLDFELVKMLSKKLKQPLVCHGGTGLTDETFRELIRLGIAKINVSTALKCAYIDASKMYFESESGYAPMKMIDLQYTAIREMARRMMTVFDN